MKNVFFLLVIMALSLSAFAQSTKTIKGVVLDSNGSPLQGATVEATGSSEVTTVNFDGTFSLEVPEFLKKATARYQDMSKTMSIKSGDMVFRMDGKSAKQPKTPRIKSSNSSSITTKSQFYLGANYSYLTGDDSDGHMGGLMFGILGKWGWYMKTNFGTTSYEEYHWGRYFPYYTQESGMAFNLTTGFSKRIYRPLHFYLGAGIGLAPSRDSENDFYVVPEIGLLCKMGKHFYANVSYQSMVLGDLKHVASAGFGYAF